MNREDFRTAILVDQTPKEAFDAIINVRGWWSENIEGRTAKLGDEFTYRFEDVHYCKVNVINVVPNKTVVWQIVDNHFNFTKDKTEWKDTKMTRNCGFLTWGWFPNMSASMFVRRDGACTLAAVCGI